MNCSQRMPELASNFSIALVIAASALCNASKAAAAEENADEPLPMDVRADLHADLKHAQGEWSVVRHWSGGLGFGELDGTGEPLGPKVHIGGDRVTLQISPNHPTRERYAYQITHIDAAKDPKEIDVVIEVEELKIIRKGIYVLDEGTIRCEFAAPDQPRPKKFQSLLGDGPATNLFILRRREK